MFPPPGSDGIFNPFNTHQQDLILGQASLEEGNLTNTNNIEPISSNDDCEKKILRKEIERQRRQHMSKLNASLRSLLPLESIKGKHSVSDQIHEAEKYITHLQKNIQDLSIKRDKLRNLPDSDALDHHGNTSSTKCLTNCVSVSLFCDGVEILIRSDIGEDNFLLSRVLEVVVAEGLDLVRCVSTHTDEGNFHTIQAEVSGPTCVDLNALQQKLSFVII